MSKKELDVIEQAELSLANSKSNSEIKKSLSLFGYTSKEIGEGESLLAEAKKAWSNNQRENDESKEASSAFSTAREALEKIYSSDRKRAKVIFRKEPLIKDRLKVSGSTPRTFAPFIATAEKLYSELQADTALLARMARMQFTTKLVATRVATIATVKELRASYYGEKGEAEEATRTKDSALTALDEWMDEFIATAKIALEDTPQLLEALGIITK